MSDKNQISMESKITFTLKGFVATIMSILGIFASFYFMVVDPRIEAAETNAKELLEVKTDAIEAQLNDIKGLIEKDHENFRNGIKAAIDASDANTHRFKDIIDASTNTTNGGGGSSTNN